MRISIGTSNSSMFIFPQKSVFKVEHNSVLSYRFTDIIP